MIKEYKTLTSIAGPLIIADKISGAKYDELVEVETQSGEIRNGKVLEVDEDKVLVQVFEGTSGLDISNTKLRLKGRGIEINVAPDMLGRIFSGLGEPIDGSPQIIPEKKLDINGKPINPFARDYPDDLSRLVFLRSTV